jgi:hypothetical protein
MVDRMLLDILPVHMVVDRAVGHTFVLAAFVEHIVVVAERIVVVVWVASAVVNWVELLLDSIVGKVLGPCRLWSRLYRSIYHSGCIRRQLVSWGGRNIDRVMEPERVRLR